MAVLITGASGGIGEAFARILASERRDLFLVARSADKLEKLCAELREKHQINADFLSLDLTQTDADAVLFDETTRRGQHIDWLINNAGFGNFGDFAANDLSKELSMIDLNVRTLVGLTHRYLPAMRAKKNGVIINVSSTAGFQPVPFMATYAASKAFVTAFSEALWEENREFGVEVIALCPGGTSTNFFNQAGVGEKMPMRSLETPEQVVATALQGVKANKSQIISGWGNYFVANAGNFVPNWIIAQTIGSFLRPKIRRVD